MKKTEEILKEMTLEEKISLITGKDFFESYGVERLGVPSFKMSDGPHGVRTQDPGEEDYLGLNKSNSATCFPSGVAMGSSWNPELTKVIAKAIGKEAKCYGINVMLGPAFNIKRSPLCGRDFEYFSEDPYLSGKLAASYIRSIQSENVAACPKHFAGNSQEYRRMVTNSVIGARALREIYLAAFEIAVKEGNPWSIMCAYNKLNGIHCSQNKQLLTDILRDEWGFDGAVISDWGAVSDRAKAILGGLDLEMPGTNGYSDELVKQSLEEGSLTEEELDRCVLNILNLIDRTKGMEIQEEAVNCNQVESSGLSSADKIDYQSHHELARRAAEECMVLLKNEDKILPFKKTGKTAVIGALAKYPRYQGGGSSHVTSWSVDTPLDCLGEIAPQTEFLYAPGYDIDDGEIISESLLKEAESLASDADTVLVFVGLTEQYESEGLDRKNMKMPKSHNELVQKVLEVNPDAVIILTAGAPVELPWISRAKALISTYTTGDGMGCALARIIFGEVTPSGKLAETMPVLLEHNPSYLTFHESETDIHYNEGIFVGYRWYEKRKIPVMFPFGHGLSYTDFAYSDLVLDKQSMTENDTLHVGVKVTNTGSAAGMETVQLYVSELECSVPRPVKELKGFSKVMLQPGETKAVEFDLSKRSFAFYDDKKEAWRVQSGDFEILIGASSADIRLSKIINIQAKEDPSLQKVTKETTYGELVRDERTYSLICNYLKDSPMYRPAEMPDVEELIQNLPLWTMNHMGGMDLTPETLESYIEEMNQALKTK